jgi:hypothetical protein
MSDTKTTVRRIRKALGPGLTTRAGDDDPSAASLTWTMFLTLPFMAAIQIISAI